MKICGFSFIKNAVKYDYPIVEAITSILPICDEFVIALGKSEDDTEALIKNINSNKIKIVYTEWNESLRKGGHVLADETNKAFQAIGKEFDWAFYIQGDEVIHEKYLDTIVKEMKQWKDNSSVESLIFKYQHFYGSYDYIGNSRKWYRREIRVIKNDKSIYSYRDAQGFRKNGKKLKGKLINAKVNHYGWVKPPEKQQAKQLTFNKLWHDDKYVEKHHAGKDAFDYSEIDSLARFTDTHPKVMQNRIDKINWEFDFDPTVKNFTVKDWFLYYLENSTGWRPGEYKNYIIVR
ncbi:MAG: glycosyltransferase family 2 protein [Bacteroidota bacterium]|nr:glycosyltransferase family 2 protein [Bacteroidota bacterium]